MLRDVHIRPVLNGWIVEVGCQTVVFTELGKLLGDLEKYYVDPDEVEKMYLKNSVNSGKLGLTPPVGGLNPVGLALSADQGIAMDPNIGAR